MDGSSEVSAQSVGEILESRHDAQRLAAQELANNRKSREFPWDIYNTGVNSYAKTFRSVMPTTFEAQVREKAPSGNPFLILDLMGDGKIIRDLHPDGAKGLAVTLADTRDSSQRHLDFVIGVDVLGKDELRDLPPGDILSKKTWKNIDNWLLYNRDKNGYARQFDLTVIRPEGGIYFLPADENLLFYLLNKAYTLTSDTILTQIPNYINKRDLLNWVNQLEHTRGLDVAVGINATPHGDERVLRITKSQNAPELLPPYRPNEVINIAEIQTVGSEIVA